MKSSFRNSWIGGVVAALCLSITSLQMGPMGQIAEVQTSVQTMEASSLAPVALAAGASLSALSVSGCSVSASDIENSINVAIQSAEAVLAVAEPGASWVSSFSNAVTALEQAETQWKGGGAVAILESALNTLAAVSAVIPFSAPYAPLVGILVAGIDAVLSSLPVTASVGATVAAPVTTPYRGKVKLKGRSLLHPTHIGAYKAQWNAVAKANPLLTAAILK
jgi:hypothetical protein